MLCLFPSTDEKLCTRSCGSTSERCYGIGQAKRHVASKRGTCCQIMGTCCCRFPPNMRWLTSLASRSEEHTSELQSLTNLVCRLLLEKKKKQTRLTNTTH